MTRNLRGLYLSMLMGVVLAGAGAAALGACKVPGKEKVPPIKITDIDAQCEVKDHQRLLKLSYKAINIKNKCSGGQCVATLLTKIRVYDPKGSRVQLRKKDTRNRLDHRSSKKLTGGTFWFTVPLPGDASAGTYTVRIEADDKLRGKWDVKKTKVTVPAEPIPAIRLGKVATKIKQFDGFRLIKVSYHAEDVYNRCREGKCKASFSTRLRATRPDGKPAKLPPEKYSNKLDHAGEGRIPGGNFSFGVPVVGKGSVGTWTLHIEVTDLVSKKTAKRDIKVKAPKPVKGKKK